MMMADKLNAMRLLEQYKVPYEVMTYDDSIHDAGDAADAMGVPRWMVYKTLVVRPEGSDKPVLAMVAADRALDLKRLAAAVGVKKVSMASYKDAEALTGLKVGGIGALALMHKHWISYLDQRANEQQNILVNPGQRGINVRLPVTHLIGVVRARLADISQDAPDA
jgi:Cys-tRNA(Pro)/Cys-tRNA(Cys) deacylase